jgi:hypothetical protein
MHHGVRGTKFIQQTNAAPRVTRIYSQSKHIRSLHEEPRKRGNRAAQRPKIVPSRARTQHYGFKTFKPAEGTAMQSECQMNI